MKRILVLIAALASSVVSFAYSQAIRDIDIKVVLDRDGSADISERWDVCASDGTEWYLVRGNLADMTVSGLAVTDEKGIPYIYEGEWDVDRSIREKAGRCGIVTKKNGVEICWGIGSVGDHIFEVSYRMSNAVKTLEDYDMLHMQLVSPGLSSRPQHVRVSISAADDTLGTDRTRAWGFGYEGTVEFRDGAVVFESGEPFRSRSSVIALLRFDKGMFDSPSIQHREFSEVLSMAMDGADFGKDTDDDSSALPFIISMIAVMLLGIVGIKAGIAADRKRVLGVKPSEVQWCRDIPYGGNLPAADHVLSKLHEEAGGSNIASALILRMIYEGAISVGKSSGSKVELSFNDALRPGLDAVTGDLYDMMVKAGGKDRILQDKEFSSWSSRNQKTVEKWISKVSSEGRSFLLGNGYLSGRKFTPQGQENARMLAGLKKFLKEFTLMDEKGAAEAVLWREYLVYGAMFGIADKVARQLRDIDPKAFESAMEYDYGTMRTIIFTSRSLSNSIITSAMNAGGSVGGLGGHSSFGGGGGFSGGGAGGGGR